MNKQKIAFYIYIFSFSLTGAATMPIGGTEHDPSKKREALQDCTYTIPDIKVSPGLQSYRDAIKESITPTGCLCSVMRNIRNTPPPAPKEKIPLMPQEWIEHEYQQLHIQMRTWAESFDVTSLDQVKRRKDVQGTLLQPQHQWIAEEIYRSLEACSYGYVKNILIFSENYTQDTPLAPSSLCALNTSYQWGPVLMVQVNPEKFMSSDCLRPNIDALAMTVVMWSLQDYFIKRYGDDNSVNISNPIIALFLVRMYDTLRQKHAEGE